MNTRRKLLIAEDQPVNQKILQTILQEEYNLVFANNGREALDLLLREGTQISAVLLDLIMPEMDGYAVLQAMQKDTILSGIPVIVMTQENRESEELRSLSLGAYDFLTKPYRPEIIKRRIDKAITLRETAAILNRVERDNLTGLYNKDFFYTCCERSLKENPEYLYDIVCMDIDKFKLVNDLYGKAEGDKLLRHFGDLLLKLIHECGGIVSRMVADTFLMFVPRNSDYEKCTIQYFQNPDNFASLPLRLRIRFGIYRIDDPALPVSVMCDRAKLAAEEAKDNPTGCVIYNDGMRKKLLEEQSVTGDMNEGIAKKQFEVYLQPKIDLKTEEIIGAEALVRWNHPVKGFLTPGSFIPVFERNGYISALDHYVWESTCDMIRDWKRSGAKTLPVSVNVSRSDVYNPLLPDQLMALLKKYELEPKDLYLEITETSYTQNPEQLIAMVKRLKELGFTLEMDDFGSGYSSLNMLSALPIDILKLDMGLVRSETDASNKRSILHFIIDLAQEMAFPVVAEGVETKEQAAILRDMGCDFAQGYYYAKPMTRKSFERLLMKRGALKKDES